VTCAFAADPTQDGDANREEVRMAKRRDLNSDGDSEDFVLHVVRLK